MHKTMLGLAVVAGLFVALSSWADDEERGAPPSRLATLYKLDPITRSISLKTGAGGHMIRNHHVYNYQSDLDFGNYHENAFTAGIEGGRRGAIVDLGSTAELAKRYEYSETVGGGQGYASIRFEGERLVIRNGGGGVQPLRETFELSKRGGYGGGQGTAPVILGHVYLVRITDRHDPGFERIAKLIVVSHRPDEYVTFRWDLLRDKPGRRG